MHVPLIILFQVPLAKCVLERKKHLPHVAYEPPIVKTTRQVGSKYWESNAIAKLPAMTSCTHLHPHPHTQPIYLTNTTEVGVTWLRGYACGLGHTPGLPALPPLPLCGASIKRTDFCPLGFFCEGGLKIVVIWEAAVWIKWANVCKGFRVASGELEASLKRSSWNYLPR